MALLNRIVEELELSTRILETARVVCEHHSAHGTSQNPVTGDRFVVLMGRLRELVGRSDAD